MLQLFKMFLVLLAGSYVFLTDGNAEEQDVYFLGRATQDAVKIRSGYNKNFGVLYSLKKDELVVVCGKNFSWYKVMLPLEVACYVCADFVEQNSETTALVKANKLNIRSGPDAKFEVIGQVEKGEELIIKGKEGNWYKISPTGDAYGWVYGDYLENIGDAQTFLEKRKKLDEFEKEFKTIEEEYQKCQDNTMSLKVILEEIDSVGVHYSALSQDAATRIQGKKDIVSQKIQCLTLEEEIHETKLKGNIIEAEGKIRELGRFWGKKGTHRLINNSRTLFYLESENLDLNSFFGYKVKVKGFVETENGGEISLLKVTKVVKVGDN